MGRGKSSTPSLIQDERKRVQTFYKRIKGLEKKAYELATLCSVSISMIMFGPENDVKAPTLWPEDPNFANKMINLYQKKHINDQNSKRNVDISSIYKDRAKLVGKEVEKLKKMNMVEKYPVWDELYDSLSYDQLLHFGNQLNDLLELLKSRIDSIQTSQMFQAVSSQNQLPLQGLDSNTYPMFQSIPSYNQFDLLNNPFDCFGNESSSHSNNNYNNNNVFESNFDRMNTNGNYHLPPLPGNQDNFVQNNMVMDHIYAPPPVQMPVFMPSHFPSVDPYAVFGDASTNHAGNFNFQF